jgi:hypothetical protein
MVSGNAAHSERGNLTNLRQLMLLACHVDCLQVVQECGRLHHIEVRFLEAASHRGAVYGILQYN